MSTASKPATAAFALVTGASSGIGAKNERVSRPLEAQEDTNPGEERHA
jgi:NADP-dependent 3-hydroxy acid dehydrogenase YdfG